MPSSLPSLSLLFVSFLLLLLMAHCGFYRLRSLSYVYFWTIIINKFNFTSLCALTEGVWVWKWGGCGFPFMGATLYVSARDSLILEKQMGMFSVVSSRETLGELFGEPNSLLAKPVGLLQGKMWPSVCVVFQKCTFLHPCFSFQKNTGHVTLYKSVGASWWLMCWKYKTSDRSEEFYFFIPYRALCLLEDKQVS